MPPSISGWNFEIPKFVSSVDNISHARFQRMSLHLPMTWRYWLTLALVTEIVTAAHELAHHFTNRYVCGSFGRLTFNLWTLPPCSHPVAGGAAGPALSFGITSLGAWLLWRNRNMLAGYTLIAASHIYMRAISAVTGHGDEVKIVRNLQGPAWMHVSMVVIVVALSTFPLVVAYLSLHGRRRFWIFSGTMAFPMLVLTAISQLDTWVFIRFLEKPAGYSAWLGVPRGVWAAHAISFVLLIVVTTTRPKDEAVFAAG
jgi:hypothetical protein